MSCAGDFELDCLADCLFAGVYLYAPRLEADAAPRVTPSGTRDVCARGPALQMVSVLAPALRTCVYNAFASSHSTLGRIRSEHRSSFSSRLSTSLAGR